MSLRELKEQCEAGLSDLPIPHPFSVEQLRKNMEEARGISLIFHEIPEHLATTKTACGLRIATPEFEILLYRRRPTDYQTEHVKLHELMHSWFRHGTNLDPAALRELVPVFDTDLVERVVPAAATVQARANYNTKEERIAELGASMVPHMARSVTSDDMLGRLGDTLSHPVGGRGLLRRIRSLLRRS
ncbi:toxin [Streptomyces sp. NPDC001536]|uniref:toxin n=1 Tax=Streptomyces sp. NPDC001536 TaxID=3364583 RepID=UPI0036B20C9C